MSTPHVDELHESRQSLWRPVLPPIIWATHFMLTYVTAAVWCAKVAGRDGELGGARVAIALYTVAALAGIVLVGKRGWQRHVFDGSETQHDFDSPADRHRFLGFATALLAGLSAVATIFTALAVVFFKDCR
jgi:hypothetical protein